MSMFFIQSHKKHEDHENNSFKCAKEQLYHKIFPPEDQVSFVVVVVGGEDVNRKWLY